MQSNHGKLFNKNIFKRFRTHSGREEIEASLAGYICAGPGLC